MGPQVSRTLREKAANNPHGGQPDHLLMKVLTHDGCLKLLAGILTGDLKIGLTAFDLSRPAPPTKSVHDWAQLHCSKPNWWREMAEIYAKKIVFRHFSACQHNRAHELFQAFCERAKSDTAGTPPPPMVPRRAHFRGFKRGSETAGPRLRLQAIRKEL
jgi:hypothetical protein